MTRAARMLAIIALAALLPAGCGGTATPPPVPTAPPSPSLSSASPAQDTGGTSTRPQSPPRYHATAVAGPGQASISGGSPAPGPGKVSKAAYGKAPPLTAGPVPGSAYTVVRAGGLLVAGTEERGALVSIDGAHWRPMNDGLPADPAMTSVAVEPGAGSLLALVSGAVYAAQPRLPLIWRRWGAQLPRGSNPQVIAYWPPTGSVLVGDGSGALYAAGSAGKPWREADRGLPVGRAAVTSLVVAGGFLNAGLTNGLATSVDGATWRMEAGVAGHDVAALAVLPHGGLAAALDSDGLAVRDRAGGPWRIFSAGALGLPAGERVLSLTYDPAAHRLYFGTLASGVRTLAGLAPPARPLPGVPSGDPVNGLLVVGQKVLAAANSGIISLTAR